MTYSASKIEKCPGVIFWAFLVLRFPFWSRYVTITWTNQKTRDRKDTYKYENATE